MWGLDLFTPQLFIAAILMNGPIALSSIVLRRELTIRLVVVAQIANIVAGYVNGIQADGHWDGVAIGDRVLLAASYLLVGFLVLQAQDLARRAGMAALRQTQTIHEQELRRAIGNIRSSLSPDLVLRAVLREAIDLFDAKRVLLYTRASMLTEPQLLTLTNLASEATIANEALPREAASIVGHLSENKMSMRIRSRDAIGQLLLDRWQVSTLFVARLPWKPGEETVLFVLPNSGQAFDDDRYSMFVAFSEQATIALTQASLFDTLALQNERISERNETIRDIVYAVAHDLRTPITAANTTMKQALAGAYGELPEAYRQILQTTILSNDELRNLAETLLLVARYELGDISHIREPVDLFDLCASIVREMSGLAADRGIRLFLNDTLPSLRHVSADASELRRAIMNVVANAIAATPQQGHVELRLSSDESTITLSVEDDGFGVSPDRQSMLFARFGKSNTARRGGMGLGLNIVRQIVEKHGGSVRYEPRIPNGSLFVVTLPSLESP